MAKASLSSDLDLVKEVEQLRIKQKLLLTAIKEKDKKIEVEKMLNSISSQISFLVEIFKEANNTDENGSEKSDEDKSAEKVTLEDINTSITLFKEEVLTKISDLDKKILKVINKKEDLSLSPKNIETNGEINSKAQPELPKPDFSAVDELKDESKKGWFSKK